MNVEEMITSDVELLEGCLTRKGVPIPEAREALWRLQRLAKVLATVEGDKLVVTIPRYGDIQDKAQEATQFATDNCVSVKFEHNWQWFLVPPGRTPEQVLKAWKAIHSSTTAGQPDHPYRVD